MASCAASSRLADPAAAVVVAAALMLPPHHIRQLSPCPVAVCVAAAAHCYSMLLLLPHHNPAEAWLVHATPHLPLANWVCGRGTAASACCGGCCCCCCWCWRCCFRCHLLGLASEPAASSLVVAVVVDWQIVVAAEIEREREGNSEKGAHDGMLPDDVVLLSDNISYQHSFYRDKATCNLQFQVTTHRIRNL